MTVFLSLTFLGGCEKRAAGVTRYFIDAVFDGNKSVSATMTVDYYNDTETEIKTLKFNLFPNAFRKGAKFVPCPPSSCAKAYPNGVSYGGIEIENCYEGGEPSPFEICGEDRNILSLSLKKGVFPSERATVKVDFSVVLPECALRLGSIDGYVNLGNWFPILCVHEAGGFYECEYSPFGDPFYSAAADYTVSLTVPGEFSVAACGNCVSTETGERSTKYVYEIKNARDFAAVFSKKFHITEEKRADATLRIYYADCPFAEEISAAAISALETFGRLFGKYPFGTLSVVFTEFLQGGLEYPSLVYVSDALGKEDAISAAVHEIAHQWWYAAVGNNQIETAYIDEGLAEYSTLLFYENNPTYGVKAEEIINAKTSELRAFYGAFEQINGSAGTALERKLSDFSGEYEYVETVYAGAPLMFDGLRRGVGNARFFAGLKNLYEDNKFGIVGRDELILAFERAGCDAEGYINSWADGKVLP